MEAWFRGSITFCHIARNFAWDVSRFWRPSYSILLSQNAIKRVGCINDRSIVFQFIWNWMNLMQTIINRFFHWSKSIFKVKLHNFLREIISHSNLIINTYAITSRDFLVKNSLMISEFYPPFQKISWIQRLYYQITVHCK